MKNTNGFNPVKRGDVFFNGSSTNRGPMISLVTDVADCVRDGIDSQVVNVINLAPSASGDYHRCNDTVRVNRPGAGSIKPIGYAKAIKRHLTINDLVIK